MTQALVGAAPERSRDELLRRNEVCESFFREESGRLAEACHEMSRRFLAGGRLLAFGRGAASTDAQHVSVEFVHPVIVGKRALPALDLGPEFATRLASVLLPEDTVMGFAFPDDGEVEAALRLARRRGALTFALAGAEADYAFKLPDVDPFVSQEVFEILYHVLWETVHVYFEHREQGHDVGASAFLYPFLGKETQSLDGVMSEVQSSMLHKMQQVNELRASAAEHDADRLTAIAEAMCRRLAHGGKLIVFGNGGSATDANDLVIDCVTPPAGLEPIPAVSLSAEPAVISAIANDIGPEAIFARQIIAQGRAEDVAIGISTSGSSPNILAALRDARQRGLLTVALAGYDGGRVVAEHLADEALVVPCDYIPRIQETQASLYHVLRRRIADLRMGR